LKLDPIVFALVLFEIRLVASLGDRPRMQKSIDQLKRMAAGEAWVEYFRSLGQTDEMLAAKRALIEERLSMAANFNLFDFSTIDEFTKKPVIDWSKVADSPYGAVIAGFKFDRDSGVLTDFERDNALQALAQLRDMHGFKAPAKTAFTDPSGNNAAAPFVVEIVKFSDASRPADKAAV
jgi:hypothetical protein